jgi:glycosyltransferase involved in cell wall biosynthesis
MIYWPEPAAGLSRARNSGILRSSGEIVAFADDDVVVHPRWLVGFREVLSRPGVLGVTGLVLAAELETESQIRFEFEFDGFNGGYRPIIFDSFFLNGMLKRGVPVWKIGAGANIAFRREVFSRIGLFDERLGAGASGCSEDSEFWYRMLATGMPIAYEPRAVVWHRHRADRDGFRKQMKQYMRGHVAALLVQLPLSARIAISHGRTDIFRKGLDLLLDSWAKVRAAHLNEDWRLTFIGSGDDASKLRNMLRGLHSVVWVDCYIRDRLLMRSWLSAADVYVMASRHEGFPVAPLEGMACGLPVVATAVPSVAEIMGEEVPLPGIVVPIADVAALASGLETLLGDSALSHDLSFRAKKRVQAFSSESIGTQLRDFQLTRHRD